MRNTYGENSKTSIVISGWNPTLHKRVGTRNADQLKYRYPFVMKKVFNWSELHLSEVTSYKIHILEGSAQFLIEVFCLNFCSLSFI